MRPSIFEIGCVSVGGVAAVAFFTAGMLMPYPSVDVCMLVVAISLPLALLAAVGFGVSWWIRQGASS